MFSRLCSHHKTTSLGEFVIIYFLELLVGLPNWFSYLCLDSFFHLPLTLLQNQAFCWYFQKYNSEVPHCYKVHQGSLFVFLAKKEKCKLLSTVTDVILCSSSPISCRAVLPFCKKMFMTPSSCCILHRYPCPFIESEMVPRLFPSNPCPLPPIPCPLLGAHTYPLWFKKYLLQKTLAQLLQDDLSVGTYISVSCQLPLKDQIMSHCSCSCSTPSERSGNQK